MNVEEKIKEFEKEGYNYSKDVPGGFYQIITPSGAVYNSDELDMPCPLCYIYMRDNNEDETTCIHAEKDEMEMKNAYNFLTLIREKNKRELAKAFGIE